MRWRPKRAAAPAVPRTPAAAPPLPPNPYRRFYTPTPTFEELVRRARTGPAVPGNMDSDPRPKR